MFGQMTAVGTSNLLAISNPTIVFPEPGGATRWNLNTFLLLDLSFLSNLSASFADAF